MAYVPNPTDVTQPVESVFAKTAAAEFRALKAYIQTIVSGGGPGATPPGAFQFFQLVTAPPGWFAFDGQTFGSVGSGAVYQGAQYQALFTSWWDYSNALLPIFDSAGVASVRGASANADWLALKRLTSFNPAGRFPRVANGSGVVNGNLYEGSSVWMDTVVDTTVRHATQSSNVKNFDTTINDFTVETFLTGGAPPAVVPGKVFAKVRPDNIAMLGCYKL